MDWRDIMETILKDEVGKWEEKVTARELEVAEFADGGSVPADVYPFSELARTQVCRKLGIPAAYYRSLPDKLKNTLANHALERLNGRPFLVRGKGKTVRAFLSEGSATYKNWGVARIVYSLLRNRPVEVESFVLQETHMFLKIISDEASNTEEPNLKAGVMIGNSEVGLGSVSMEPFLSFISSPNELIVPQKQAFRRTRKRLNPEKLSCRMAAAIRDAFRAGPSLMDSLRKTRDEPVEDAEAIIRTLARDAKLPQEVAEAALRVYRSKPDPTGFGIINAFMGLAQALPPLERIEMERFAGRLLEAPLQ